MVTSKEENLNWQDYSVSKKVSLDNYVEKLLLPLALYKQMPLCHESVADFLQRPQSERVELQKAFFKELDDSALMTPYCGFIAKTKLDALRSDLEIYSRCMLYLARLAAHGGAFTIEQDKYLKALKPERLAALKSALATSKLNYAECPDGQRLFAHIDRQPLYAEMGIDIMSSGDNLVLAEFQVRYTSPYPHLLAKFFDAYKRLVPDLFERFKPQRERFADRRALFIETAYEHMSSIMDGAPERLLIDAWAYLENYGANWKALADSANMTYTLFDDFKKEQNLTERKYRRSNIFVFNQPSLHLLDPDEAVFQPINSEKLETYPELAWPGLARKVCDGSAYFLNSPVTDLINDKALYSFLPDLAALLYGKEPTLPVIEAVPAWSLADPAAPDRDMLEVVRANQADYVITHRYLEGGLGIRVGAKETEEEWSSFLDTFVADRPYLYVYRKYFKMEPDVALRLLVSSLGQDAQLSSEPEMTFTDTVYGRFSPDGHITSETAWCFGVFAGDL
jgi:hypothetical protein